MMQRLPARAILLVLVGVLAGCDSTIPRAIDPSTTPTPVSSPQIYSAHGISFAYPGDWMVIPMGAPSSPDPQGTLSSDAVGLDRLDLVVVSAFDASVRVTPQYFAAHQAELEAASEALLEGIGYHIQGEPEPIAVAGLPGLRWPTSAPTALGYVLGGTSSIVFDVTTLYLIRCPSVPELADAIDQGCDQILGSFAFNPTT